MMRKVQDTRYKTQGQSKLKNVGFCLGALLFFLLVPCPLSLVPCFAQPVASTELINNARLYDGKDVTYEGEAIGDIMRRGTYAWVNLNDGKNAIGCWVPLELAKAILYTGTYKSKGDWIEVTGSFQRACPQHGGDLDIHVQALRKMVSGTMQTERFNLDKRNLALLFLGVVCLVLILSQLKRK